MIYGIPFLMTSYTIIAPNGAIAPMHYLYNSQNNTMPILNLGLFDSGSKYVVEYDDSGFGIEKDFEIKKTSVKKTFKKLYSVAGFEITLLSIGVILTF